ncbi:MAG: hypothetical protein HZA58_01235 [Acidimicrobiia bacterium]|nr:hypothetical protein [Acidimicrobiia bacterium]
MRASGGQSVPVLPAPRPPTPDPAHRRVFRYGGVAAIAVVTGYVVAAGLYVAVYPFPEGGQEMLEYLSGKETVWWTIVTVSALTDVLYPYVAFSLYHALKGLNRDVMLMAAACMGLFAILELAISWPAYASLISLSSDYAAASMELQRMTYAAAADSTMAVINSTLLASYAIALPGIGSILVGLVMRRGIFGRTTAYLAVAAGTLAIVSVVVSPFAPGLERTVIAASLLTTLWLLLAGIRLWHLGGRTGAAPGAATD